MPHEGPTSESSSLSLVCRHWWASVGECEVPVHTHRDSATPSELRVIGKQGGV